MKRILEPKSTLTTFYGKWIDFCRTIIYFATLVVASNANAASLLCQDLALNSKLEEQKKVLSDIEGLWRSPIGVDHSSIDNVIRKMLSL